MTSKGQIVRGYLFMLFGCLAYACSTVLFLAPNEIVAGGVTGLSVMLNILNENIQIGLISIAINIPILLLGIKFCGIKFVLKCLLTITTLGLLTDALALFLPSITDDAILASLYGGICQGIGIGFFVKYEFSSGGTELLGRVVSGWTKFLKIPVCVGILDGIIVILGSIVTKNFNNMLYALIVIFVSTKLSEVVLMGLEKSKFCIIITDRGKELSETLLKNSPRGITMMQGQGMYTSKTHDVLMTCVKNRQLTQLKMIVKDVDENAFIIVNDSVEVRGKGFQALGE